MHNLWTPARTFVCHLERTLSPSQNLGTKSRISRSEPEHLDPSGTCETQTEPLDPILSTKAFGLNTKPLDWNQPGPSNPTKDHQAWPGPSDSTRAIGPNQDHQTKPGPSKPSQDHQTKPLPSDPTRTIRTQSRPSDPTRAIRVRPSCLALARDILKWTTDKTFCDVHVAVNLSLEADFSWKKWLCGLVIAGENASVNR